jgi:penicillin-binding protein 1B
VLTAEGRPLARYPLAVQQAVTPAGAFLVNTAMQEVMRSGTGRALTSRLPPALKPAGKTGTTDELKDSWFAGFTGNYLAVVWLGRDDNESVRLSGAGGAMQVWGDIMAALRPETLNLTQPPDIEQVWVNGAGQRSSAGCRGAVQRPFLRGTAPHARGPCGEGDLEYAGGVPGVADVPPAAHAVTRPRPPTRPASKPTSEETDTGDRWRELFR